MAGQDDAVKELVDRVTKVYPASQNVVNNHNVRLADVPTWVWVPIAIFFFVRALAIAQQIVAVATPIGGVG